MSVVPLLAMPCVPALAAGSAMAVVRVGVDDQSVRARYAAKIGHGGNGGHLWWTGALHSRRGHGRFWVGAYTDALGRRRDVAVIAHRFGWALVHGFDALATAPVLAHECDEASCQNPDHLAPATQDSNRDDFLRRRRAPGSPLRDVRGPAGRARAIRAAVLTGGDVGAVIAAGVSGLDDGQLELPMFGVTSSPAVQ